MEDSDDSPSRGSLRDAVERSEVCKSLLNARADAEPLPQGRLIAVDQSVPQFGASFYRFFFGWEGFWLGGFGLGEFLY